MSLNSSMVLKWTVNRLKEDTLITEISDVNSYYYYITHEFILLLTPMLPFYCISHFTHYILNLL